MREVASPFGAFGVNIVAEALADGPYSAFSFAIGLVMVSGGHVETNLDVGHKLLPKAGSVSGISIRNNRSGETVDREDSFNEDVGSFDCGDVLGDWDEVVNPVKRSNTTKISSFLLSLGKGSAKSIAIEEKGSLGTGRGVMIPSGRVVGCLFI